MRLVMLCQITDECTYSYTETVPFEYESKEAFLYDLLEKTLKAVENCTTVNIFGYEFYYTTFGYFKDARPGEKNPKPNFEFNEPRVYTIDEWFEQCASK